MYSGCPFDLAPSLVAPVFRQVEPSQSAGRVKWRMQRGCTLIRVEKET